MAQSRSYLNTLGPKVGVIYILGALGEWQLSRVSMSIVTAGVLMALVKTTASRTPGRSPVMLQYLATDGPLLPRNCSSCCQKLEGDHSLKLASC